MSKNKVLIGVHVKSDIDKMDEALETITDNIDIVQLFIDPSYEKKRYQQINQILKNKNISGYVHSSLKINCAKEWDKTSWWINYLIYEIKVAHVLGMKGVIIHTGHSNGEEENVSLNNLYTCINHLMTVTKKESNVKLILETPAGQGTELLSNFDEFLMFSQKFKNNPRFGICLDTCHMFSSGIDLRDKKTVQEVINDCKEKIGLEKLMLIHLNDSKTDLGQRKDRHESLGYGYIGRKGITTIVSVIKNTKGLNTSIIMETPSVYHENEVEWIRNI